MKYPTVIKDSVGLIACFDRMYDDYVKHCKKRNSKEENIFSKEDFLLHLKQLDTNTLAEIVYNFNNRETSTLRN